MPIDLWRDKMNITNPIPTQFPSTYELLLSSTPQTLFVIKIVFNTTMEKAFLCWIFNFIAKIVAIIIGIFTFATAIMSLFRTIVKS